ncbi:hypothetical protein CERSUDRAFT_86232 [Gelatoporia subvermispora B]|uniref:Uncharacterized protein n=1 Tax=Ceriporiopsis subvermispora (strain B) TaxID=914234 RepID=M2QCS4_CERS8|nr:hypothetical protein CERSUDRAFT_86232 [Gelatoporia subvermispora B]
MKRDGRPTLFDVHKCLVRLEIRSVVKCAPFTWIAVVFGSIASDVTEEASSILKQGRRC